ncbi:MAG TPA: OsmC family protein [Actinomycetota bacterium]|jgi:osmotically inducible protein OsmC
MPTRTADAEWTGTLQDGSGRMRLGGGAFDGAYSFSSRFEQGEGTNPEELIAAAHAGCFSMALSGNLGKAGFAPQEVATTATVHLEKQEPGFTLTRIDLVTQARVDGIDETTLQVIAEQTKDTCPVSRALAAVAEMTVSASLR